MKFSSAEKRLGDKINVLNKAFSGENEIENTGRDLLLLERMWILIILIILYFTLIWPEFKG